MDVRIDDHMLDDKNTNDNQNYLLVNKRSTLKIT